MTTVSRDPRGLLMKSSAVRPEEKTKMQVYQRIKDAAAVHADIACIIFRTSKNLVDLMIDQCNTLNLPYNELFHSDVTS